MSGGKIQKNLFVTGIGEGFDFIDCRENFALRNDLAQPGKRVSEPRRKNRTFRHRAKFCGSHLKIANPRASRCTFLIRSQFPLRSIAISEWRRCVRLNRASPLDAPDPPECLAENVPLVTELRFI